MMKILFISVIFKHDFSNFIAYKRGMDETLLEVSVGGKEHGEDVLWEFDMISNKSGARSWVLVLIF